MPIRNAPPAAAHARESEKTRGPDHLDAGVAAGPPSFDVDRVGAGGKGILVAFAVSACFWVAIACMAGVAWLILA